MNRTDLHDALLYLEVLDGATWTGRLSQGEVVLPSGAIVTIVCEEGGCHSIAEIKSR